MIHFENLLQLKNLTIVAEQELAENRAFILTGDIRFFQGAREKRELFLKLLHGLNQRIEGERAQQLLRALLATKREHAQKVEEWFDQRTGGASLKTSIDFFENAILPRRAAVKKDTEALESHIKEQLKGDQNYSERMTKLGLGLIIVEGLLSFVIGFLVFFFLLRAQKRRRGIEQALEISQADLLRSNIELEQFAYVASHDLQEPLRMIASFTELLAKRYKGKFDKEADEFIDFILDGARRMQTLIRDLLIYSRVGSRTKALEPTNSEMVFNNILSQLSLTIEQAEAQITFSRLPVVLADETQLGQVFQNLLSNAIKFRSDQPIKIHVSANKSGNQWVFSVQDNGIGIDPDYFDRIFVMFQRLHGKDEYPGTGIGLTVCKRIIDRHGGKIWIESQRGKGSTFYFSLQAT